MGVSPELPAGLPQFSPIKGYRLFRRIARFPDLLPQMRSTFLDVLVERGVVKREDLPGIVSRAMAEDGVPDTDASRAEYTDTVIDLLFASSLSLEEAENWVNLVRKRDRCRELGRVLASEHSTAKTVWQALREFCDIPKGELYISREEAEGIRVALLSYYVSSQLPFIGIAKNHVTIRDLDTVLKHTIGHVRYPGKLGGKAAGMIVAQKILLPILTERDPDFERYIAVPETWYLSSGVMSDFIDRNHFYQFHTYKYRDRDAIEEEYKLVGGLFEKASFPADVVESFRDLIRQIGEWPIIVRSSSFLEDSFGLAFSGKYQSLFLANQGGEEERLAAFISGVKSVLASMYGPDPIIYRRDHGLLDYNEQMAIIVQKVVGRRFGDWLFPLAAGVLYSSNEWVWNPRIRKQDGLVRLVFGLGTRAVDRVGGDYPRMIPLSHPTLRPEVTPEQIAKYSQKMVDAINLRTGELATVDFRSLARESGHPDLYLAASIMGNGEMRAPMSRIQELPPSSLCLTFDNLLTRSPFVALVKKVVSTVKAAYGRPVDIEFAWDDEKLYILQCRSLSVRHEAEKVALPDGVGENNTLFVTRSNLGNAAVVDLEYVVYVDPRAYDLLETAEKKQRVARGVRELNKRLAGKRYALMGPGRWGSNDINLGVRVTYADINNARLLVEIAFAREGYTPEVSYGTHFFADLVEADIAIMPLYPDNPGSRLNEEMLHGSHNSIAEVDPALADLSETIRVVHVPAVRPGMFLHVFLDGESQRGLGVFSPASKGSSP
jgi:hypothetical protein